MKTLAKLFAFAAAMVLMASCSDDDKTTGPSLEGTFQTFVTYMGSGDEGSSFTVTEPGTTKLTTFTSVKKFPTEGDAALLPGTRVLIYYKNASNKRYESGYIDLRGVTKIFTGSAGIKPQGDISAVVVDMIDVQLIELSGTYINLVAQAETNTPLLFDLYFDEATVDSDAPEAYVVFSTDTNNGQRMLYGSFDIKDVLERPTCRSVRVHYMTLSGRKTISFPNGSQTIVPMD